jgi:hypothetical protein
MVRRTAARAERTGKSCDAEFVDMYRETWWRVLGSNQRRLSRHWSTSVSARCPSRVRPGRDVPRSRDALVPDNLRRVHRWLAV